MRLPLQQHNLTDKKRSSPHTNLPFQLIGLDLRSHLDLAMCIAIRATERRKRTSHYSPASLSNWPIDDFVPTGSVNSDPVQSSPPTLKKGVRNWFSTYFSFKARPGVKYHFHFFAGFQFQPPIRSFLVKPGPTSVATFFFSIRPKTFPSLPFISNPSRTWLLEIVISKVFPLQTAIGSVLQAAATWLMKD